MCERKVGECIKAFNFDYDILGWTKVDLWLQTTWHLLFKKEKRFLRWRDRLDFDEFEMNELYLNMEPKNLNQIEDFIQALFISTLMQTSKKKKKH